MMIAYHYNPALGRDEGWVHEESHAAVVRERDEARAESDRLKSWLAVLAEAAESLGRVIAAHPRDWALDRRDAWVWGVVCGWSPDGDTDPGEDAFEEVATVHGWGEDSRARMKRYEGAFGALAELSPGEQP